MRWNWGKTSPQIHTHGRWWPVWMVFYHSCTCGCSDHPPPHPALQKCSHPVVALHVDCELPVWGTSSSSGLVIGVLVLLGNQTPSDSSLADCSRFPPIFPFTLPATVTLLPGYREVSPHCDATATFLMMGVESFLQVLSVFFTQYLQSCHRAFGGLSHH